MARVARALRPVENRPTAHGARAAQRGLGNLAWLCCGPSRGALLPTSTAGPCPHQHRDRSAARHSGGAGHCVRFPWHASRALYAPWKVGQPPTDHAPRSTNLATWRDGAVGQRGARSLPRRRPGLDRTNTAACWRHGHQERLTTAFESHGARRARSSSRGEPADHRRSTLRAAGTWQLGVVV